MTKQKKDHPSKHLAVAGKIASTQHTGMTHALRYSRSSWLGTVACPEYPNGVPMPLCDLRKPGTGNIKFVGESNGDVSEIKCKRCRAILGLD